MSLILNSHLSRKPWEIPGLWRLPGIVPCALSDWLEVDDAYARQMALRAQLMAERPGAVHALPEPARPAAEELYAHVLSHLPEGFRLGGTEALRPDGVSVALNPDQPLMTLGRLVQEDFCLMEKRGAEHVLTAGLLCFPGSWTLTEKLGRPMMGIHAPVAAYDASLAARVQRLFDAIRPEQPLYRMNALLYADAALYQPLGEGERRPRTGARPFVRTERQCLVRLPRTGAVVFSIHTQVVRAETLGAGDLQALSEFGH